jgi:hypothetical protein
MQAQEDLPVRPRNTHCAFSNIRGSVCDNQYCLPALPKVSQKRLDEIKYIHMKNYDPWLTIESNFFRTRNKIDPTVTSQN